LQRAWGYLDVSRKTSWGALAAEAVWVIVTEGVVQEDEGVGVGLGVVTGGVAVGLPPQPASIVPMPSSAT
jgi:hypothetical protein